MPGWSPSFTRPSERRERGKSTYDKETPHFLSYVHRSSVICGLIPADVIAVSEANGKAVPVSLDLRSSLSIQPLEGSRSRLRDAGCYRNSIDFCLKSLARRGLWPKGCC